MRKRSYVPREKEYKVDSTKGGSMLNPLNYKGDVLVQVWMDSRVLATLCKWLDLQGTHTRFMSQTVRVPLESVVQMLVNNSDVEMVDDTAEARRMLERRFNVDLNRGGRGHKNILHNVALSDRRSELGEEVRRQHGESLDDIKRPTHSDPQIAARVKQAQEMYRGKFVTPETAPVIATEEEVEERVEETTEEMAERIGRETSETQSKLDKKEGIYRDEHDIDSEDVE